jgi:peptidoglycan/LPS O-acetylase OafA/YrhL
LVFVGGLSHFIKWSPPSFETPQNILPLWKILVFPSHQFWFLQTLFSIFVIIAVLESLRGLDRPSFWLLAAALAALAALLAGSGILKSFNPPFSPRPLIFMLPYFFFGLGIRRFGLLQKKGWVTAAALALAGAGLALQIFILLGWLRLPDQRDTVFYLGLSLIYVFLLFKIKWKAAWLSKLGHFSYSIFLFHFYILMAMNKVLTALPLALPPAARFAVLFLSAVGLSILAHLGLKHFALTRRLFLGLR